MISITKTGTFDTAHKVVGHNGKCKNLHGHTFQYEVTLRPMGLTDDVDADVSKSGMLFDFGALKSLVGDFIDTYWDHGAILNPHDPLIPHIKTKLWVMSAFEHRNGFCNPTSENLARELFFIANHLLREYNVHVDNIVIWETASCKAVYEKAGALEHTDVHAAYVERLKKYYNEKVKEHDKIQLQLADDQVSPKGPKT